MSRELRAAASLFAAFSGALLCATAAGAGSAAAVRELELSPPSFRADDGTTVGFDAARTASVRFTVTRLEPGPERQLAAFVVRARAGANRFELPGRLDRRLFSPGTYRVATADASAVFRVVERPPATTAGDRPSEGPRRALVIAFLVLAIPLLAAAALPAGSKVPDHLVARRPVVAAAGGLALATAIALYATTFV